MRPVVYHIPVCPFSQRLEVLLELKGQRSEIDFHTVDITQPRPQWLLEKQRDTTALPILELPNGRVLKESLVLIRYLDEVLPGPTIARATPEERAVENMLIALEGDFTRVGYRFILNQDLAKRETLAQELLAVYRRLDGFLSHEAAGEPWLFERFGLAEAVFTPLFRRFQLLDYYEGFELPDEPGYQRVRLWREACLEYPAAQQVSFEEIIKLYYDYAKGAGNGRLLSGRQRSSFAFDPDWRKRPMPPKDKYGYSANDAELGLLAG